MAFNSNKIINKKWINYFFFSLVLHEISIVLNSCLCQMNTEEKEKSELWSEERRRDGMKMNDGQ